jgi:hypothetical protein
MGKSTNFSGQPIFTQLLNLLDKSKISKASKALGADKYVKRFTGYKHIVVMLFVAFEGYNSIRETVLGLLSNAHRLGHLGLDYCCKTQHFQRPMPVAHLISLPGYITIPIDVTPVV